MGPYAGICTVALVLAALSLLLAGGPAYDPWSWIVWGREVAHLHLITTGGPTWKPLPVVLTTLFAPFGAAAPDLWLVVARAGGIAAVGLAFILTSRLAGERGRGTSVVAGGAAALGLLTLYQFAGGVATGESEGLLVAMVLLAILRVVDGAPRQALALGFAAALLRPEVWPFLGAYGIWLWRRDAGARVLIAALFALIPALWFLPELWGSGSLTRGVQWAQYARQGSPAFARCPFCSEISGSAWPLLTMPFRIGLALALGAAAFGFRSRALAAVAALGLLWVLEEAALTQIGFSGSDRYLTAPLALLIVSGAAGWGLALRRPRFALAALAVTVALSVVAFGRGPHLGAQFDAARLQGRIRGDLSAAVAEGGGAPRLLGCGAVQSNPSEAPLAAWTLGVPLSRTESERGDMVIQSGGASSPALSPAAPAGYRLVADTAAVRLFVQPSCVR
ncbi:MAG TPA: hypothetical protein VGI87_08550 [Solirubrobacteraceae bacterium]